MTTSLGPTSVNVSDKLLPQHMVLLLGVTVEGAECCKLLLGEVGVSHGQQALTEPGHTYGSRSEGVKGFKMFRHLCACVWGGEGSGGGLMGDITQTDVQLPHPVQMYVYDPCNLDPLPLGSR